MPEFTRCFKFERSTKGAHRYTEIDTSDDSPIDFHDATLGPTIYVRKSAIGTSPPPMLEITVRPI